MGKEKEKKTKGGSEAVRERLRRIEGRKGKREVEERRKKKKKERKRKKEGICTCIYIHVFY